jgi:hypothetical protein
MNLQVIASSEGGIIWVSGPLPGAVHDLAMAWIWGIIAQLAARGLSRWAARATLARMTSARRTEGGTSPTTRRTPTALNARLARSRGARQRPAEILADLAQAPLLPLARRAARQAIHVLQTREMGG